MAKVVKNQEKPIYQVHCTECGKTIDNKFFPLTELLKQYDRGNDWEVEAVVSLLGIGALYGQTVLPEVPAFVDREGNWNFEKPTFRQEPLNQFACGDNDIPMDALRPLNLNIASMIAQFCMNTGFEDIYPMLKLRREMDENGSGTPEQETLWKNYCKDLIGTRGVKTDALSNKENREQEIGEVLTSILYFAELEARESGKRHFAPQKMLAGWRYREENGRKMPYSLVVRGEYQGSYDARECCCDKCRRPQVWEMGAYPQKIIGILGTQAVGKTTYLMALADRIPGLKFEHMTITHDSMDPQRRRIEAVGDQLWLYQNGYNPIKTAVGTGVASALTFKIRKNRDSEPVMYTLADIPGEAFDQKQSEEFSQQMINEITSLLEASDSLVLILNRTYLRDSAEKAWNGAEQNATVDKKQIKDPSEVLSYLDKYVKKPVSMAVVLTAADKLGNLRELLGTAYDISKLKPMVYSDKTEKYVYNGEMMQAATGAVADYVDDSFGRFMHNLEKERLKPGSKVSAFIASSGTQCATADKYTAAEYDQAEADRRYRKVCEARFGIEAPLLWLLTRDGLLDTGRADSYFNGYDEKVRRRILNEII